MSDAPRRKLRPRTEDAEPQSPPQRKKKKRPVSGADVPQVRSAQARAPQQEPEQTRPKARNVPAWASKEMADAPVKQFAAGTGQFRFQQRTFFLKKGTSTEVVFAHDYEDSVVCPVHIFVLFQAGRPLYGNTLTCNAAVGDCPLCKQHAISANAPLQTVRYFSVIDLTPFTTKAGQNVQVSRKMLQVKSQVDGMLHLIKTRLNKKSGGDGDLMGMRFVVNRTNSQKSQATGDMWQPDGLVTEADWDAFGEENVPLDLYSLLAPNLTLLQDAAGVLATQFAAGQVPEQGYAAGQAQDPSGNFRNPTTQNPRY